MAERRIVVAVPGPSDRAFYKAFMRWLAKRCRFDFKDLDRKKYQSLKSQVLDAVAPSSIKLQGASVVRLGEVLDVIVWPLGGEQGREKHAWQLLGYHLGLEEPGIDLMVAVRDMEERCAHDTLEGIYASLKAGLSNVLRGGAVGNIDVSSSGKYYFYIGNVGGKGVNVLLIAQGLEQYQCCGVELDKHAVEDFLLFLGDSNVEELLRECRVLRDVVTARAPHKKLAGLAAIASCRPCVDDGFVAGLVRDERVEHLLMRHDGLRYFANLLRQLLTGGSMSGCG